MFRLIDNRSLTMPISITIVAARSQPDSFRRVDVGRLIYTLHLILS